MKHLKSKDELDKVHLAQIRAAEFNGGLWFDSFALLHHAFQASMHNVGWRWNGKHVEKIFFTVEKIFVGVEKKSIDLESVVTMGAH